MTQNNIEALVEDFRVAALGAESYKIWETEQIEKKTRKRLVKAFASIEAERDALQAQLDSMTQEWARGPRGDAYPLEMGSESKARYYAAEQGEVVYRRLVGPWVEVAD
jgi:cell division protein FtsB